MAPSIAALGLTRDIFSFILNFDQYRQEDFCTGSTSCYTIFKNK